MGDQETGNGGPPPPPTLSPEALTATAIRTAVRVGQIGQVLETLQNTSPVRRAELFVQLRVPEQKAILTSAPPDLAASLLADCDSGRLEAPLMEVDLPLLIPALQRVPPDNLADIALHLPSERRRDLLRLFDDALRQEVERLMTFDPDSAGGLMTTRYLSIPDVVTVGRALELLRAAKSPESLSYVYVVDVNGKLVGMAPLRSILLANPRKPVRDVMSNRVVKLRAAASREEMVNLFNQYHYVSLPVTDDRDRLIGIVTADDVMAEMRRGEEQIVHGVTGASPREALMETFSATRSRIPWITVTILGGLGCALIASLFQHALEKIVVLGIFIPIVLALGESIAAQTTSVMLTSLLGGSVLPKGLARFVVKELSIGFLIGLYAGLVVGLCSALWHTDARLGLVIGGAVTASVAWATILGVVIPGVMVRSRVDPAIASGPLVLALADLSTLVVYFGGAALFLLR